MRGGLDGVNTGVSPDPLVGVGGSTQAIPENKIKDLIGESNENVYQ